MENKKTSPALFVRQVRQELQKVTWPTRRDTFISSLIVILLIFLFSLFFLLSDQVWSFSIKKIIEIGSGKVLTGLNRRMNIKQNFSNITTFNDIENFIKSHGENL